MFVKSSHGFPRKVQWPGILPLLRKLFVDVDVENTNFVAIYTKL